MGGVIEGFFLVETKQEARKTQIDCYLKILKKL
jgi:hypothetical protein